MSGINISDEVKDRINSASDPLTEGIKICSETIRKLRSFADGVHIMAIGTEEHIPKMIRDSL